METKTDYCKPLFLLAVLGLVAIEPMAVGSRIAQAAGPQADGNAGASSAAQQPDGVAAASSATSPPSAIDNNSENETQLLHNTRRLGTRDPVKSLNTLILSLQK